MASTAAAPLLEYTFKRSVLYDASALLARRDKPLKRRKSPRTRDPHDIGFAIVHKSGADGPAGLRGAQGMARFCIEHRGWDDPAYTYWYPRVPEFDADGRYIWYRCNDDTVRSWHTGGRMNVLGVGHGVQGNYDGDGGVIERSPTEAQMICLADGIDYCERIYPKFRRTGKDEHGEYRFTGHWEHGKIVCPGDALQAWVREMRGGDSREMAVVELDANELDPLKFSIRERQFALFFLGFDVGPLDAMWGYKSRAALETFQRQHHLRPDGDWGRHTAAAMALALRAKNRSDRSAFFAAYDQATKD